MLKCVFNSSALIVLTYFGTSHEWFVCALQKKKAFVKAIKVIERSPKFIFFSLVIYKGIN